MSISQTYIDCCRRRLKDEYLPRVERCLNELSEEDIWWRAHETDNSIGNLILHLSGNIRQWIIGGLGEKADHRNRSREFAERAHIPKETLLGEFRATILEADCVLARFDAERLAEIRHIQQWDVTCLDALSHVVEHFAQHLGQIIYVTKLRTGKDLKFWNL